MTRTANTPLTDVHDMVVVHRVFRRELRLIPQLVRAVAPGDTARAAVLAGWSRMVLTGLHGHHTSEDLLLWPKLLERCEPDAELVHRMEEQHSRVHAALEDLGPALRGGGCRGGQYGNTWAGMWDISAPERGFGDCCSRERGSC